MVVVTKDLPLRLKASIVGLEAEEYRNELATDTSWTGFVEPRRRGRLIDELYARARRRPAPRRVICRATPASRSPRARSRRSPVCTTTSGVHLVRSDRSLFDVRGRRPSSAWPSTSSPTRASASSASAATPAPARACSPSPPGSTPCSSNAPTSGCSVFRPLFAVGGQELGYLPGTETEKMPPWAAAVTDALESIVGPEIIEEVFDRDLLEVLPAHPHPRPQPHRQLRDHRRGTEPRAHGAAHRAQPARTRAAESCSPTTSPSATTSASAATTASSR